MLSGPSGTDTCALNHLGNGLIRAHPALYRMGADILELVIGEKDLEAALPGKFRHRSGKRLAHNMKLDIGGLRRHGLSQRCQADSECSGKMIMMMADLHVVPPSQNGGLNAETGGHEKSATANCNFIAAPGGQWFV
jgi:hypothetical protein